MGQVNVVRMAVDVLRQGGSIILTSGILSRNPWPGSAPVAMVNGLEVAKVYVESIDGAGIGKGLTGQVLTGNWA